MSPFNTRDKVRLKANPSRTGFIRNKGAENKTYGVRMDDTDKTEWHDADNLELIPTGEPFFKPGDKVSLRTRPAQQGVVQKSEYQHSGFEHEIFFDANNQGWYPERSLTPVDDTPRATDGSKFLRDLALIKLRSNLSDTLYSYRASRTNVEPYQFKPAMKFFESPNHRLFIADEVGLGKTIEAGIIYLELKARNDDLKRVLVVCPSGLRYKWRDEMFNRFSEEFEVIENASQFRERLNRYHEYGDAERFKAIVSMETIRRRQIAELIHEVDLTLDLVIIDEAHHMRNSNTLTHRVGRTLSDVSDSLLMLSATPIQLRSADMFNQFRILDEGEFNDLQEFEQLREPNIHINRASQILSTDPSTYAPALEELRKVEKSVQRERYVKNPFYLEICERMANSINPGRKKLVELQRDLQQINTFAPVFNRTTKRDVSSGVVRAANIINVDLSADEKAFYDSVMEFSLHRSGILASIQRERATASCISAAREYILDRIEDHETSLQVESTDPTIVREEDEIDEVQESIEDLQDACNHLGDTDSKFEKFIEAMTNLREESPNSKVLVFAVFRRTIEYLHRQLAASASPHAGTAHMIHGGVPQHERLQIIDRFKASEGFGILLLSEIGSEGLDFQFCDTVFNYDLPWNPMRVEQRIGRIDRYGQESERIRVYSLVLNDTIEERILARLYERINVFKESIGDLEVILGDEIYDLQRDVFRSKLTPAEQELRTETMLRSIEFKRKQAEDFQKDQDSFMGQDIIFQQQFEEIQSGGRFISGAEIKALIEGFIKESCPESKLAPNPRKYHIFNLRAGRDLQSRIQSGRLSARFPPSIMASLNNKIRNPRGFPVTFDGELGLQNPRLELLNLQSPIVVAARDHFASESVLDIQPINRLGSAIVPTDDRSLVGEYGFFIYWVKEIAVERLSSLVPIVIRLDTEQRAEHIEASILASLQQAQYQSVIPVDYDWDELSSISRQYFTEYRDNLQSDSETRNNALIDTRIASLRQTSSAKVSRWRQLHDEASSTNIQNMRRGQISNEEVRLQSRIDELESRRSVDLSGNLVLAGYARFIN